MALQKAKFVTVKGKKTIHVHFNPSEYSIAVHEPNNNTNEKVFEGKEEILTFTLYFDTYMGSQSMLGNLSQIVASEDVRLYTNPVVALAERGTGKDSLVTFIWGSLHFKGYVSSVNQRFTMFMDDGRPVRAVLDVTMYSADETKQQAAFPSDSLLDDKANLVENVRENDIKIDNIRKLL